ncbi:M56 family metallopeptidase [Paenibacillus sp. 481]|uniref:M56 family metallopeptidase n=1 Tax=Paenibacillus sp. 481 TaxID=2835869 RepID=UPI001E29AB7D|nr:M56 family metallopeptidase [Paenibacillus sp. 481]UHA73340.1 M56 family metallopeptidase [Paenibacillus sp. 481]
MSPTWYECLLSFFGWVVRGSFMASILILLVLILQFIFKKNLEVRWKYLLWIPVAIRLLLPWAPESSFSLYNVFSVEGVVPVHQLQTQSSSASHNFWLGSGRNSEAAAQVEHSSDTETSNLIRETASVLGPSHQSSTVWDIPFWWSGFKQIGFINMLMLVWLLGVLIFAVKMGCDQFRLKQALRAGRTIDTPYLSAMFHETKELMGVKRDVQFIASEHIPGPALVGLRKPAIVISPSLLVTLQQDQLQCILAHEFAHVQRRDGVVNWMMHILLMLHWFNPLLWLAVHKARQDQEMACDAFVLDRLSPQQSHTYGKTIIHVLEHFHYSGQQLQPGLAGLSATHKQMKRRLLMIKRFHKKSYHLSLLGMAIIAVLGSVTLVNAEGNDVEATPSRAGSELALKSEAVKPKAASVDENPEKAEIARIFKLLEKNPYDTYMVYVSNELMKQKGRLEVSPLGNTSFDTYEAYLKKVAPLKEVVPQQPVHLPEGYTFNKAKVYSSYTSKDFKPIIAEAKKLGKQVYSKKINVTKSDYIHLTYTNGEDFITISNSHLDEHEIKGKENEYRYISAKDMAKKEPQAPNGNYFNWRVGNKSFQFVTNPGNPLTKEDLIKLAKTAVK